MVNYKYIITTNNFSSTFDNYDEAYNFATLNEKNTIPPHNWHVMMKYPALNVLDSVAWGSKILIAYIETPNTYERSSEYFIEKKLVI